MNITSPGCHSAVDWMSAPIIASAAPATLTPSPDESPNDFGKNH
ncbi:hypothetical protein [Citrobacter portucalensis]|nr:hypothetical protein [Citrobacter portucalensis]